MERDMQKIAEIDFSVPLADEKKTEGPSYAEFLASQKANSTQQTNSGKNEESSFWQKLIELIRSNPRRFAVIPGIAAIILIVVLMWPATVEEMQLQRWVLVTDSVSISKVISNSTRGAISDTDSIRYYADASEAALAGILNNTMFDLDYGFSFDKQAMTFQSDAEKTIRIKLIDSDQRTLYQSTESLKYLNTDDTESLSAWLLIFTDRKLYNLDIEGDQLVSVWPSQHSKIGCLVFVTASEYGYRYLSADWVELE
jgi:hypothetical protein